MSTTTLAAASKQVTGWLADKKGRPPLYLKRVGAAGLQAGRVPGGRGLALFPPGEIETPPLGRGVRTRKRKSDARKRARATREKIFSTYCWRGRARRRHSNPRIWRDPSAPDWAASESCAASPAEAVGDLDRQFLRSCDRPETETRSRDPCGGQKNEI